MAKIRVGEDGWLALPASVRRILGLKPGSDVDVEVKGGALILRPADKALRSTSEPEVAEDMAEPAAAPVESPPPRKRGRPRKVVAAAPAPEPIKARGRRKSTKG